MKNLHTVALLAASLFAGGILLLGGPGDSALGAAGGKSPKILEFDTLVGVPRGFTGSANPIRGISGGGLPWVIARGEGELRTDGSIEVNVEGLVLDPNDPTVISRGLAGVNPIPSFRAIVSCLTLDGDGNPEVVNLQTALFPADAGGNASIEDQVELPDPCIAPIIFVTSPGNMWFAATGF